MAEIKLQENAVSEITEKPAKHKKSKKKIVLICLLVYVFITLVITFAFSNIA